MESEIELEMRPVYVNYLQTFDDLDDAIAHCESTIQSLKGTKHDFYVGMTNDFNRRASEHYHQHGMTTMFVLCKTQTRNDAIEIERYLIDLYMARNSHCLNGRLSKCVEEYSYLSGSGYVLLNDQPNYVYLLFE